MSRMSEPLTPLTESQQRVMEEAVGRYQFERTDRVDSYLMARGIDPFTADRFRLGEVVTPVAGHQRFRGMVAIPYLDKNGSALSVRFRCIEEHDHREVHGGKYASITGEPTRLYNIRAIHEAPVGEPLHITEGEFDAIVLTICGYHAIACPGAASWKFHYATAVRGFSRVYVWGDDDEAGAEFVQKVCRCVRAAEGVNIRGGDVTELFLRSGVQGVRSLIERSST